MSEIETTTRDERKMALGRRAFLTGAAALPILTEAHFAAAAAADATGPKTGLALHGQGRAPAPAGAVLINANENPLGPTSAACEAIAKAAHVGGRYDLNGETQALAQTFARQNGLKSENILVYAGSSEPLHFSVLAFTSPTRGLVVADPTYEAPVEAAKTSGAKVTKVALTSDYAHDIPAMMRADPSAGVIYICNPNNPTGTLTSKAAILEALKTKPAGSILLVDEAYIHLTDAEPALDLVAAGHDVIVLRTFSKIYGMAGIRAGFAVGRPDLLAKLAPWGMNAMPVTASAAARASLEDPAVVPERKRIIGETRRATIAWLKANGYKVIGDPQTNCFMIDTGRDGRSVMAALRARNVIIGRTWPVWPNAVRVSVGTPEEMAKFQVAFHEVMSAPAMAFDERAPRGPQSYPHYS